MVAREACMVAGRGGMCGCQGGMRGCQGACMVAGGACVVAGGHAWLPGGVHGCWGGSCIGYDEIQSMSGQYTSYLNAFLFIKNKKAFQ